MFTAEATGTEATAGTKLKLRHAVDDGVVIYLNGVEIHRFGIAAGEVNFQSDATGHENAWEGPYEIPITDGSITLEWTGGGTLQAAASITGPWQGVPGAASPYKVTPTAGAPILFGRIKK
jgi:hypothetical protein